MKNTSIKLPNISANFTGSTVKVKTRNEDAHIVIKKSKITKVLYKNDNLNEYKIIPKKDFKIKIVGKDNYKRKVIHFLYHKQNKYILRMGITHHLKLSSWSSLPHKFETNLERGFEELFFYILKNSPKTAVQVGRGVWHNFTKVNKTWIVKDKSFSIIPMGYHPVVGMPDVSVSYIWAYLAKHKRWEKI